MAQPKYFIKRGDKVSGPFSEKQIRRLETANKLRSTDGLSVSQDGPWRECATILKNPPALPDSAKKKMQTWDTAVREEAEARNREEVRKMEAEVMEKRPLVQKAELEPASPQDNPNLTECPDCKATVSRRASSCPKCGAPIQNADQIPVYTSAENRREEEYRKWKENGGSWENPVVSTPERKYKQKRNYSKWKCPTCNSNNIKKISVSNKVTSVALFGVFAIGHVGKTFKCNNCGYKW